ncbi:curli production assembly/transport protein CsgE [Vibrio methylphosphonaticus]|uniref:curli production assembly/transport protein CsgE n=1 Tax=Vibrio methylphosphonaticus TaxID=2946866 RepID=UPI002029D808|nr:curli production assembly/transport protein CsgE [Vibrio methylphosphonaticus]MCL9773821.1 curli production assembly/transport protein CsgE [Vibrio methylphosphonaticus]
MKTRLFTLKVILLLSSIVVTKAHSKLENGEPLENGKRLESQQGDKLKAPFNDFSEVDGVIVDRTITRLGEDFYFFFSQQLNDRYPNLKENLTIKEIPTALSGSIIEVYHSRKAIYRTALSPGRRLAKDRAGDAIQVVGNYIIRWQAERLYMDTFDLEHDEF